MCTPVILADRFPPSTHDTPTSTRHVIIARAELRDRQHQLQKRVFKLWEQVATALHQEPGPDISMPALAECWPRAEELDDELPDRLQRMMEMAE